MCKGDQLKWQSARFAFERHRDRDTDNPIGYSLQLFSLPISTHVCCAKQKRLKNRNNVQGGLAKWQSARFAFERHRDRDTDTPIGYSLQLFSLPLSTQVCCAKQKRLENRKNVKGGLAQVVERSIRIRQAPGWRPGYSNQFFFTIIFVANCNTSFLCQTEKVGEQKQYLRGISSSGRALDSHSRGTAIETRISNWLFFTIIFIATFNASLLCQTDRDTDTPIGYSLQLFSLPISTQVCCAKQKRLENRNNVQGGLAQVVERSIRIREAPGYPILHFTIIFGFVVPNRKG